MTRAASSIDALVARHGDVQVLPVSYAQRRFWMLDQIDGAGAYTIPLALRLVGALDVDALRLALQTVVDRHEALRTVFTMDGDEPVQVVLPRVDVALAVEDVAALDRAARDAVVAERAAANANAPFDLGAGPLVRASLLRLAQDEHVLLVALHHVVADGWSIGVLFDELREAYGATRDGRAPDLRPLALQYADYSVWQRRLLHGTKGQQQLAYWTARLRDVPVLELQTDRPRPAEGTSNGAKCEHPIPRDVADAVRALARRERATPYMAFLAAFFALLHRYTGQTDIVVGSITSGRLRAEVESLIGLFVNTLAVRVDVAGDASFVDLLHGVQERAMEAYANQDVPFEQVVEAVQPARDRSRTPIFQVAFQLIEGLAGELELPGVVATRVPAMKDTTKFDLTLMIHPAADGGLRAVIEYNTDLFDRATVTAMLRQFHVLLSSATETPDAPVRSLSMLTGDEIVPAETIRTATAREYPRSTTLAELVAAQAVRTPTAIAVEDDASRLTYAALLERADAFAARLRASGADAGALVGVCMERSVEMMVALLGVLRAGAAYVPLDPAFPAARLAHVLGDCRAWVIVTEPALHALVDDVVRGVDAEVAYSPSIIHVGDGADDERSASRGAAAATAPSIAYVLYTSGSTGKPKGVAVSHRALVNFLWAMTRRVDDTVASPGDDPARPQLIGPSDTVLAVTTLAFDIAGLELWAPLVTGGRVVIASRATVVDGAALAARLASSGATVLQATPATWRLLLAAGWQPTPRLRMLVGGEALPPALAAALLRSDMGSRGDTDDLELWNLYGPTETTIWSSTARITPAAAAAAAAGKGVIPLGNALANEQLLVLEPSGSIAPLGVPGELVISGDGVAEGYLGRAELTAERFTIVPRLSALGRVYRTGDRARRRSDGTLEYLGRLDTQVKLRGFRIELGEIESTLSQEPTVGAAVAAVREDVPGEPQLVAYVTPANGRRPETTVLRELLRSRLPEYMMPSAIVVLDSLPSSPNGKLDRRALPAPDPTSSVSAAPTLPRTPLEEQIAAIWRDALARDVVGVHDDFFAIGGHSLLAMRVVARMADAIPVPITIGVLFRARTVAALAAYVTERLAPADELGDLLAQLETMSDLDAARLLRASDGVVA